MLSGIWNTLKSIGEFFSLLFDFVIDFFKGIADFIVQLLELPALVSSSLGSLLPPAIFTVVLALVAAVIVLRVIGRD